MGNGCSPFLWKEIWFKKSDTKISQKLYMILKKYAILNIVLYSEEER